MYSNSNNKIDIPISTNWQQIAIFIAQNKNSLSYIDLMQANRRL